MRSRPESRKELRLNGCNCRGPVSGHGFTAQAETSGGELEIESEQPFVVVTRDSGRQELFAELNRGDHGELLLIEDLADPCHVIYLAIAIVEKTIAIERPYEIL